MRKRWIAEGLFKKSGFAMKFEATRVIQETATGHQHLVLFQNPRFGKILMLDGATQLTTADEFIYHEMMVHVPLFSHGDARSILIIGGGDCGCAREVLKHKNVVSLTQVEIDPDVVEFSKNYFPEITGPVFSDPRFELIIEDGMAYVRNTDRAFDIIIVDSTDPHGPGAVLFTYEFYAACAKALTEEGILIIQNGVPFFQPDTLVSSVTHMRKLFCYATCYIAAIPTYVGGHMAMGFATNNPWTSRIPEELIALRYREAGEFRTKYWNPKIHTAAFALPQFIAELTEGH